MPPAGPLRRLWCPCKTRWNREAAEEEARPANEERGRLPLTACELSRQGAHQRVTAPRGGPSGQGDRSPLVTWDDKQLLFFRTAGDVGKAAPKVMLEWGDVSGIWTSLRVKEGSGLFVEVALETRAGDVEFMRLQAPINDASGRLLEFLQEAKSDRLKDGRAPRFAMSWWAIPLYRQGFSANRVRVALGWTSTIIEVIFAVCFLSQLHAIVASRESRLLNELANISSTWDKFGGVGALVVLVQHIFIFLFTLRSIWSTLHAGLQSLLTFGHATKKAHKSLKKLSSRMEKPPAGAGAEPAAPEDSMTEGNKGGGLRQRRHGDTRG